MEATTQFTALILILLVFILNALVRRHDRAQMRRIRAFAIVPQITGESIEANRPLHVSLGGATIGGDTTLLALVGKEFIYYLTREVVIGDASPIFTVSDTTALPLTMDTLRRAYNAEGRSDAFLALSGRWYPSGNRLAFAAALMTMQADDQVSGNVLTGRYGAELALVLNASNRHKKGSIAVSDRLDGQAVAYALATEALIGEEIFAAPGYLSDDVSLTNRNIVLDRVRWLLILVLIGIPILRPLLPTILETIGSIFGIGG
ncbi:MAG: hypothetical protein Q9P01_04185 [Anaerolineae bacterium]|nr:hypothetical protein [Anaerolineae bacterium]MDQ7034042.1 hypothetical protein [Anaerolineae bacterium]